jgi:hypothetical protein
MLSHSYGASYHVSNESEVVGVLFPVKDAVVRLLDHSKVHRYSYPSIGSVYSCTERDLVTYD